MKKLNKIALAVLATALTTGAFAAEVVLTQKAADLSGGAGAEFRLGAVAKIDGMLELVLKSDGLAAMDVAEGQVKLQAFAFGQKDAAGASAVAAEDFSIDASMSTQALMQAEVCTSTDAAHISKLTAHSSVNVTGVGNCTVTTTGTLHAVAAEFYIDYEVRAAGGLGGLITLDIENGVEDNYLAADAAVNFLTATAAESTAIDMDGKDIGVVVGSLLPNGKVGAIKYNLAFDVSGLASKPVSRATFSHLLQVQ